MATGSPGAKIEEGGINDASLSERSIRVDVRGFMRESAGGEGVPLRSRTATLSDGGALSAAAETKQPAERSAKSTRDTVLTGPWSTNSGNRRRSLISMKDFGQKFRTYLSAYDHDQDGILDARDIIDLLEHMYVGRRGRCFGC